MKLQLYITLWWALANQNLAAGVVRLAHGPPSDTIHMSYGTKSPFWHILHSVVPSSSASIFNFVLSWLDDHHLFPFISSLWLVYSFIQFCYWKWAHFLLYCLKALDRADGLVLYIIILGQMLHEQVFVYSLIWEFV